jgi:hypothetical protein
MRHLRTRALPPAHQRQGLGGVLHIENYQRYKRSGAEQLGHDEQAETETGGRRFAAMVVGLGIGFHLISVREVVATLGVTRVRDPRLFTSSAIRTRGSPWSAPWSRPTVSSRPVEDRGNARA